MHLSGATAGGGSEGGGSAAAEGHCQWGQLLFP